MRLSKYNAQKCEMDGLKFDSKLERNRYLELDLLLKAGEISELTCQPKYPIDINGVHICNYLADFEYIDCKTGQKVVEDTKGFKTPEYKLKKKLVEAIHGIKIVEVH